MVDPQKVFLVVSLFFVKSLFYAQCSMCKAVVESDMQSGNGVGAAINDGIIYLMFIPYILIGTVGYFIYRHYKKNKLIE